MGMLVISGRRFIHINDRFEITYLNECEPSCQRSDLSKEACNVNVAIDPVYTWHLNLSYIWTLKPSVKTFVRGMFSDLAMLAVHSESDQIGCKQCYSYTWVTNINLPYA